MTTILMAMVLLTDPDTYMEWIAAEEIAHKSKIMIAYNYICDFMKYNKITNKTLKACASLISHPLSYVYNHSPKTDIFPDHLKIAVVKHCTRKEKKEKKNSMTNCRPISLLMVTVQGP